MFLFGRRWWKPTLGADAVILNEGGELGDGGEGEGVNDVLVALWWPPSLSFSDKNNGISNVKVLLGEPCNKDNGFEDVDVVEGIGEREFSRAMMELRDKLKAG